jgi:hypothetical protein
VPVKHYMAARDWPGESPFSPTTKRLRGSSGWDVHEWETRHNVMHDGPGRVLRPLAIQFDPSELKRQSFPHDSEETSNDGRFGARRHDFIVISR